MKYAGYGKTFTSESDILENCTEDPDFEPLLVLLEETGTTSDWDSRIPYFLQEKKL